MIPRCEVCKFLLGGGVGTRKHQKPVSNILVKSKVATESSYNMQPMMPQGFEAIPQCLDNYFKILYICIHIYIRKTLRESKVKRLSIITTTFICSPT